MFIIVAGDNCELKQLINYCDSGREQGNLNLATLAHTTCLLEAFYQNLVETNLWPVPSASHSTDTDASMDASDKSTSGMDDLKLWMVSMREQTNAMFAEMHQQMVRNENTSARLDLKVDQTKPQTEKQITDITTMVDHRDDDAKLIERKVNDVMQQLDIKIQKLKQAAAKDQERSIIKRLMKSALAQRGWNRCSLTRPGPFWNFKLLPKAIIWRPTVDFNSWRIE